MAEVVRGVVRGGETVDGGAGRREREVDRVDLVDAVDLVDRVNEEDWPRLSRKKSPAGMVGEAM